MLIPLAELIHPNWHIAVVHFPIALLLLGIVLELCSFVSPTLRPAARWMILFGALAGPAVAYSGLFALNEVVRESSSSPHGPWYEVVAGSKLSKAQWEYLSFHAYVQLGATVLALFSSCVYLACSDGARKVLYFPLLLLMLGAGLATGLGAHLGGHTVYAHGTAVKVDGAGGDDSPWSMSLPSDPEALAVFLAPPLELHTFLAGLVVSLGCVGLACAWRNGALVRGGPTGPKAVSAGSGRFEAQPVKLLAASRLLLITTLAGGVAATAGWWHLAHESETYKPKELYEMVVPFPPRDVMKVEHREELRRPVHVAVGGVLMGVPLVLAFWVRLRPHGRLVLALGTVTFVTAAVAQTGVGSLLLFDEVMGPVNRLASPPAPEAPEAPAVPSTGPAEKVMAGKQWPENGAGGRKTVPDTAFGIYLIGQVKAARSSW